MLVAGAICPHPPLLVPELAAGAAHELEPLRAACDRAVQCLLARSPDLLVVVGGAPATGELPATARADLQPYGLRAPLGGGPGPERLPLAHTIGTWLLDRAGYDGVRLWFGVSEDEDAEACAGIGTALAERAPRVAVLAMGDGSARRGPKAPGYHDVRAVPYDDRVRALVAAGDTDGLLALDPGTSRDLLASGRAAWQVLAGATAGSVAAEVLRAEAPYGVAYLVATWLPAA